MVVIKILEATLAAGATTVTFTDSEIPNSLIRVYSTDPDLMPVSQSLTGNTLTITYDAQSSAKGIAVDLIKQGLDIVDNVTSTDADKALSANQGKVLKDAIDSISIPENITDLYDVSVTDIENGQVLAWNSLTEKFENVDQSGGSSSDDYSTTESIIGHWLDNTLYRRVFDLGSDTNIANNAWYASGISITNLSKIVKCFGVNSSGTYYPLMAYHTSGAVNLLACRDGATANVRHVCIEYTKTS